MWYDFSGSLCPILGTPEHEEPPKCNSYVTDAENEPDSDFLTRTTEKGVGNMTKRFKKLLSALCIIALLVSSIATVFANGDPEAEVPAAQEPVVEATATENNETEEAAAEAPAQEAAPVAAEAPAQEAAPAVEEAPVQEAAPAVTEATVQETAPAVTEAPAAESEAAPSETALPETMRMCISKPSA